MSIACYTACNKIPDMECSNKDATMPGLEGISLGRYRLKQRLGRGGMAEVYLATDERMQREVAIKIVSSSQSEFAERFAREAQAMGNLHHDHLLPAYDYGEQGSRSEEHTSELQSRENL